MTTSFAKFHLVAKRPVLQYQREYYAHLRTCSPAAGPYSQSTEISLSKLRHEKLPGYSTTIAGRPAGERALYFVTCAPCSP
jgi:hypothetical protein